MQKSYTRTNSSRKIQIQRLLKLNTTPTNSFSKTTNNSNTTIVKVKSKFSTTPSALENIQIQRLLKLNLEEKLKAGQELYYSNTTIVKVK